VSLTAESTSEESSRREATGLHQAVAEAVVKLTGVPPSSVVKPPRAIVSSSPEPAAHSTCSLPAGYQSLDDLRVRRLPPATLTTTNPAVEPSATSERRLLVPLFRLATPSGSCSDCSRTSISLLCRSLPRSNHGSLLLQGAPLRSQPALKLR
jgi:hypothetical protein